MQEILKTQKQQASLARQKLAQKEAALADAQQQLETLQKEAANAAQTDADIAMAAKALEKETDADLQTMVRNGIQEFSKGELIDLLAQASIRTANQSRDKEASTSGEANLLSKIDGVEDYLQPRPASPTAGKAGDAED